ncbi:MAG TPA: FxSxx-COOH system tetratricopeptide repeat protein, partial [Ktedonobacteraceae bacterium]|nr:FxSxx-COOH system tetratricopeptide repeat protein [Ktedonobacteraceae bacterium]
MKQEGPPPSLPSLGQRIRWHRLQLGLSQEALAEATGVSTRSLRRWEQDLVLPQKIWRERLSLQFGVDPQALLAAFSAEANTPSPSLWTVPYARNLCFTGREEVLQTIHAWLATAQSVASTQAVALSGMGGIGKTQVAIEYAYRYRQEYHAVFWLGAETSENLITSLQQMADLIQLPAHEAADQSRLMAASRRWFVTHRGWLVIIDNVEDLDVLQPLLPLPGQGALLLTTRRQAVGTLARPLALPPMSEEEGINLLLARSGLSSLHSPEIPLSQNAATIAQAAELVRFLEGLPLALDQAGSYLQETGCQFADYLQRCHEQHREMLARRGLHGGSHPASVTTTVTLSAEQVAREHPAASDLLRLCAFLHADAIPEEMLVAGSPYLGPVLGPAVADPYQFDLMLAALRGASLVNRQGEQKTLSVHRLVQSVLRDQMQPAEIRLWHERVALMLNAAFPCVTFDTWVQCERQVAHVLVNLPFLEQRESPLPEASELLFRAGSYLLARGRLAAAEPLLQRAVALQEQAPGADARTLCERLEKLAELHWMQGKYALAEQLLQQALTLDEQEPGSAHPRIAGALNILGELYWMQGKYEQAESVHLRALRVQEQALAPSFARISETLHNLGVLYYSQGKYEQAEALYQRALVMREEHLGAEHPETAGSLNALGLLYWSEEKYEQAEPVLKRALEIREKQLGADHPDIGASLNNLAALYRAQGKYEQAENLYQRALLVHEEQLGPEHPDTAASLNNLADLYRTQGKDEQAEALHLRALAIREQQLGREHPDTALSLNNLAVLYRNQKNYEQAEPLFVRALAIREQQLGAEHPDTATSLHGLALLRQMQGNYFQARDLIERALKIRAKALGCEHPQTRQ